MNVLVAIDLSATSDVVVAEMAVRPWPSGTNIEVLSVADIDRLPFAPSVVEELQQRVKEVVARAGERLCRPGVTVKAVSEHGDPRTVIVDRAAKTGADWIVVGAHSTSGIVGFLLGSVSKYVIREAPCSVEVVRPSGYTPGETRGMRVLLATDGSDCSKEAAQSIAARPWPNGTEVRVLSAVELAPSFVQSAFGPPFVDAEEMERLREEALSRAQESIGAARLLLEGAGLKTSESLSVLFEDAKKIILDEARDWKADLVVVGSHGRRGFERVLIGSVSEAVAMHAPCSVDVVRSKKTMPRSAGPA